MGGKRGKVCSVIREVEEGEGIEEGGTRLSARCHFTEPKMSRFPGPNPLPLALIMDAAPIKSITHGVV